MTAAWALLLVACSDANPMKGLVESEGSGGHGGAGGEGDGGGSGAGGATDAEVDSADGCEVKSRCGFAPAEFYSCEGHKPGDPCRMAGTSGGRCDLAAGPDCGECTNNPETPWNECLGCVECAPIGAP